MVKGVTGLEYGYKVERTHRIAKDDEKESKKGMNTFNAIYNKALESTKKAETGENTKIDYYYSMYNMKAMEVYSYMSSQAEFKG